MPRKQNITKRASKHIKQNTTPIPKQKRTNKEKKTKLIPKRLKFAQAYLINGLNATEAAITAGYSKKTAYSIGQRLLKIVEVQKYISERAETVTKKFDTSLENIMHEAAKLAFGNIQDFYDKNGNLIPIHELDRVVSATITELEHKELYNSDGDNFGKLTKLKKSDKLKALAFLKSFHDSGTKKYHHEVTGANGAPVIDKPIVRLCLPDNKRMYDTE
jgi:phage terminase small subunit